MGQEHPIVSRPRRDRPSCSPSTNLERVVRVECRTMSHAAQQPYTAGYGRDACKSLEFRQDGIIHG